MVGIYKITSPSGKIYIGQSVNLEKRKRHYQRHLCKKQAKLFASLSKYGFANHTFDIIEICDESMLNEREEFWISEYDTFNTDNGLNLSSGGLNKRVSEETKQKISVGNKGKNRPDLVAYNFNRRGEKLDPKRVEKMRLAMTGRKHSEDTKIKISSANKGKTFSDEAKSKMSLAAKAKNLTKEHLDKLHVWAKSGKSRHRKIIDTATGNIYGSLIEAATASGFSYGHFKAMISGRRLNTSNYKYYEDKCSKISSTL